MREVPQHIIAFDSPKTNGTKNENQSNNLSVNSINVSSTDSSPLVVSQYTQLNNVSRVFLSTAVVNVYNRNEELYGYRVLLDMSPN